MRYIQIYSSSTIENFDSKITKDSHKEVRDKILITSRNVRSLITEQLFFAANNHLSTHPFWLNEEAGNH